MGEKHFDGKVDSEYLRESAKRVEKVKILSYKMMQLREGMKYWNDELNRKTEKGEFFGWSI